MHRSRPARPRNAGRWNVDWRGSRPATLGAIVRIRRVTGWTGSPVCGPIKSQLTMSILVEACMEEDS